MYFNREEEQLLKKLLNKMRAPAPGTGKSEEAKRLDAIVGACRRKMHRRRLLL